MEKNRNPKCVGCGKALTNWFKEPKRCLSCNNLFRWSNPDYKARVSKQISISRIKMKTAAGDKNPRWMGDKVSYGALHNWVRNTLGTPNKCQKCKKVGTNNYKFHWANISREYKRIPEDWIRLCAVCHKLFDQGKKQTKYVR